MMSRIIIGASAARDLTNGVRFIRDRSESASKRFIAEANSTFLQIARMPGMGMRFELKSSDRNEFRLIPLSSPFKKYVVFYRLIPGVVEIVRVLHGARDIDRIIIDESDDWRDDDD